MRSGFILIILVCLFNLLFLARMCLADMPVVISAESTEQLREGKWLVKFYAPWCGHCKRLAPTWDAMADERPADINVAKIDCTEERELCSAFGVRGFPTIKYIEDGSVYDYSGARTAKSFFTFAQGGYEKVEKTPFQI